MTLRWPRGRGCCSPALARWGCSHVGPCPGAVAAARRPLDLSGGGLAFLRFARALWLVGSNHAGADLPLLTGIPRPVPVVGSVAEAMVYGPQVAVVGCLSEVCCPRRCAIGAGGIAQRLECGQWFAQSSRLIRSCWLRCNRAHGFGMRRSRRSGRPRRGRRCPAAGLAVGTDMSVGKMSTALGCRCCTPAGWMPVLLARQAGILIAGGVPLDAVRITPLALSSRPCAGGEGAMSSRSFLWRGGLHAIQAQQPPLPMRGSRPTAC